jgi:hypothetical protein
MHTVPTERHGTLWGLRVGLDGEITYLPRCGVNGPCVIRIVGWATASRCHQLYVQSPGA